MLELDRAGVQAPPSRVLRGLLPGIFAGTEGRDSCGIAWNRGTAARHDHPQAAGSRGCSAAARPAATRGIARIKQRQPTKQVLKQHLPPCSRSILPLLKGRYSTKSSKGSPIGALLCRLK